MILITINNLSKKYQTITKEVESLKNINLDLYEGEILGIVGPSGSGKSTLLNILTELDKDYSGYFTKNVEINIGYMMQNDALLPWKTVYENCIMGLKLKHLLNDEYINYTKTLLNKYGLGDFMNEYPDTLSGGMKQRVG